MSGVIPETRFSVSPSRLRHQCELISDWVDDELTRMAIALLPDWVTWLADRGQYPEPLRTQLADAAARRSPAVHEQARVAQPAPQQPLEASFRRLPGDTSCDRRHWPPPSARDFPCGRVERAHGIAVVGGSRASGSTSRPCRS